MHTNKKIIIGIIREGKVPFDKRVALTPKQCKELIKQFPEVGILIQKSPSRCFPDSEYAQEGFDLVDDVSSCDILIGIKEVPIENLIPDKTYMFFSHTIKKQSYNRKLLQEILTKNIRLIDYEVLTNPPGNRIIAFGRFAGIVGAYNGLLAYGLKYHQYDLKPAHMCFNMAELWQECKKVKLPAIKIALTGGGRVANGAEETLKAAGIKKVSKEAYLNQTFDSAVYAQLDVNDYHIRKDGQAFDFNEFFKEPNLYDSTFHEFLDKTDMLIAGAYWDPNAPVLFTKEEMRDDSFKIKIIADITCDIEGSIPSTKRASTISQPLYDYNPLTEELETALSDVKNITVMAVDNLPNELPRDASEAFGRQLLDNVVEGLIRDDQDRIIDRATITLNGSLNEKYNYLKDFVSYSH